MLLFSFEAFGTNGNLSQPGAAYQYATNARYTGMGGSCEGQSYDASAAFFNPAGLTLARDFELSYFHKSVNSDTASDFLGIVYPTIKLGTFSMGELLFRSTWASKDEKAFIGFIAYSYALSKTFSAGLSVKAISEQVLDVNSNTAVAADLGAKFTVLDIVSLGISLENLVKPGFDLPSGTEYWPMGLKTGISIDSFDGSLILNVDADKYEGRDIKVRGGIEYSPLSFLSIRTGVDDSLVTAGLGLNAYGFYLDYAMGLTSGSIISHTFSACYRFGAFQSGVEVDPKIFSPLGQIKQITISTEAEGLYGLRKWELNIKNKKTGVYVRKFSGRDYPPVKLIWDGKDEKGSVVPDGTYTVELKLVDTLGKTGISTDNVVVDGSIPVSKIEMEIK